jgi:hypothetical protein
MAKPSNLGKNLTQSRNRQGKHDELKNYNSTKNWSGKLKDAPRYGYYPEDSKTYRKDENAVGKVIKQQDTLEQIHDKKQLKE